jgi:chromate reductase
MKVVGICGSASENSSNAKLLDELWISCSHLFSGTTAPSLRNLPMFLPEQQSAPLPDEVKELADLIQSADMVFIATPEYNANIPAVLKNMFEWLTVSGVFHEKRVVAITFTPRAPRGASAMASLRNTLKSLKANVLVEIPCYQDEIMKEGVIVIPDELKFVLEMVL